MTTTPNPTAEQIVAEELYEEYNFKSDADALEAARVAVAALRAQGRLVNDPSEEQIEAVARELACLDEGDPWPTNEQLGGSLTGDRDMEYRSGMREQARDLLLVAARAGGVAPQAHAKDLSTSPGRMKNKAGSFNVAPQEAIGTNGQVEATGAGKVVGYAGVNTCAELHSAGAHVEAEERQAGSWCDCGSIPGSATCKVWCKSRQAEPEDHAATVTGDREKMIAEARQVTRGQHAVGRPWPAATGSEVEAYVKGVNWGADLIQCLADALAAAPVVDEVKLAEVIEQARDQSRKERDIAKESLGQFTARILVGRRDEWLRGGSEADADRPR